MMFAVGLVVIGLAGGPLVGRIGRAPALRLAIAGLLLGGLLIAAPAQIATFLGAVLLGLGSALLIQLVPAVLSGLQPHAPAAVIGDMNGLASAASVVAPLAVRPAGGRPWMAPRLPGDPLSALAAMTLPAWRLALPSGRASMQSGPPPPQRRPMLGRWFDLVVSVSVEFCFVFWAASAFIAWDRASLSQAPALASLFLVGMGRPHYVSADHPADSGYPLP